MPAATDVSLPGPGVFERLLQQPADRLGMAERVLARPLGAHDTVVVGHRDGGADRGVDGQDHASRVVGVPRGKPFAPRRRREV